jgi:hypothetical protein
MRVVAILKVLVADGTRAAGTLGDVLARHLDMDAAGMRALGRMDVEEGLDFLQDAIEGPRLVAEAIAAAAW